VNFKFNIQKYNKFKQNIAGQKHHIVLVDEAIFRAMKGSVVPANFWDNAATFLERGVGFSLFHKGKLATTAFSSFIMDDKLELGMETVPAFRGKGFAQYTCARLIDYSLENNYEPIWACRLENKGSFFLAQKLGFEPTLEIPYYRLCK
jgi:RimJ/RimL family protein N-acetyltransferase